MPYATNQDLPDSIKNSLPDSAQSIYRNAFNSAYEKEPSDEKASKIGWGAVKNAGWEKTSGGNWMKNNSELKDVEVFSTGLHKGEKWTEDDLDNMVANYHALKDQIKPVLKMAHNNEMHKKDGKPAMGWMSELKRVGNKLVAAFSDVPELVRNAINKKLYKRVSSEIYRGLNIGGKKYKRVLSGVGLLGADIPVVKDLKDIEVFFADDNQAAITYSMDVSNGVIMKTMEELDMSEELKKTFEERVKLMEATHAAELKKFTEQQDEKLQKFTEDRDKMLADKNKEIDELKASNLKRESKNKITEFKTFCEAQVTAGKMIPAARDILIKDIDKMEFSEGQEFSISFEKFKEYSEKTSEILDKTEHGIYLPPDKRKKPTTKKYAEKPGAVFENIDIDAKATIYMRENKVGYTEALAAVLESDPELAEKFSEAGFSSREEG
jgi:cation transport regulator